MRINTKPPRFLLASGSPRRRELLEQAGYRFTVVPVSVCELSEEAEIALSPAEFCATNAQRKALAAVLSYPQKAILTADTVVALGNKLLGKPANRQAAFQQLAQLSGKTHQVFTSMVFVPAPKMNKARPWRLWTEKTEVSFCKLSQIDICQYLDKVYVLDKAGGYALQEHREIIIDSVNGLESNVVGLPVERLPLMFSDIG